MTQPPTITTITNRQQLEQLKDHLTGLDHDGWICIDLETRSDRNNLEDWHDSSRIASVSFSTTADHSYVVPLSHPAAPWSDTWQQTGADLFDCLQDAPGVKLVGHNIKYDARWVYMTCGIDLSDLLAWDTMAGAFLMDEHQSQSLKARAVADLGVERWDDVDLTDAEQSPWNDLAYYNGLDTAYTYALHEWQREQLKQQPNLGLLMWHVMMPAIRSLTRTEQNGILVDLDEIYRRLREAKTQANVLYREFEQKVPASLQDKYVFRHDQLFKTQDSDKDRLPLAPTSKFFQEYAEQSWPVLERNGSGKPSWDASVLKRLAARGYEDADLLLRYRKLDKQISTYLSRWPNDITSAGRLHATYKPTRVVTGRLSCERPNLQQVDKKLKTCIVAPNGWRFIQVDYSQIEVRIMAHVSKDENLRRVYVDGRDVYRETGAAIYGCAPEDLTDHQRFTMKAVVLGFLYGMQPPSFVTYARDVFGTDITAEESEEFHAGFFRLYPKVREYHEIQRRTVRQQRYVTSPLGRVRRLPEIKAADRSRRWSAERQAINSPIQSTASDLMLMSLGKMHNQLDPTHARIVGTVHDSALLEVRADDRLPAVVDRIGSIMTAPDLTMFRVNLTVPLAVEFEIGARWGDPDEVITRTGKVDELVEAA